MFQVALFRQPEIVFSITVGNNAHRYYANPLFAYTANSDTAAGVMPVIRDACPTVSGLWRFKRCCTSADKPLMVL